jgi:hypothetical protein
VVKLRGPDSLPLRRSPYSRLLRTGLPLVMLAVCVCIALLAMVGRPPWSRPRQVPAWYSTTHMPSSLNAVYNRAGVGVFSVISATREGQLLGKSCAWGVSDAGDGSLLYLCDVDGTAGLESAWLGRKDSWARVDASRLVALRDSVPLEYRDVNGNSLRQCAVLDSSDARVIAAMRRTYLLPGGE